MVAIMTAAPLDMHMHGDGLGLVGMVLSVHTFGMFALAPLSGWLTDRFGGARVIAASLVTLAASALLVVTSTVEGWPGLPISLFLLGYGWNLAFVGGSGLLVRGRVQADQARVEGLVEAISWGAAAIATLGSTGVLAAGGYVLLSPLAAALLIVPAAFLLLFQPQMVRTIKTSQDRGQQTKNRIGCNAVTEWSGAWMSGAIRAPERRRSPAVPVKRQGLAPGDDGCCACRRGVVERSGRTGFPMAAAGRGLRSLGRVAQRDTPGGPGRQCGSRRPGPLWVSRDEDEARERLRYLLDACPAPHGWRLAEVDSFRK